MAMMNRCLAVAALAATAFAARPGHGEVPSPQDSGGLAFVETVTLTTMNEAVRVYAQAIDVGSGRGAGPPIWLPGARPAGRLVRSERGRHIAFTTGESAYGKPVSRETYVSVVDGFSNRLATDGWSISEPGWGHTAVCFARSTDGATALLVTILNPIQAGTIGPGRIEARALSKEHPVSLAPKTAAWHLPGTPVSAVSVPNSSQVAVLCNDAQRGPVLHVRDVDRGEVIVEREVLFAGGRELAAAELVRSGANLVALASGPRSGAEPSIDLSHVCLIAADTLKPRGQPLDLRGVPLEDAPSLHPASGGACWVATREPTRGFAYLTHVSMDDDSSTAKTGEHSFSDVTHTMRVATAPSGAGVALATGQRVQIWLDGKTGGDPVAFDAPVKAIAWTEDLILAGAGNRVYRIRASGEAAFEPVCEFQTGIVSQIVVLPPSQEVPPPQGDDDIEPQFTPPRVIHFRGESAGRELRVVQINSPRAETGEWRLEWDRDRSPWLNAYPTSGTIPGWFFLGVDGRNYVRGATDTGWLNLITDFPVSGDSGAGRPYRIAARVAPSRPSVRRILWALADAQPDPDLRGMEDPHTLRVLADALASPPYHFSHCVAGVPVTGPLEEYSVVVLESNAILSGIVTRQAVLDYVSRGGALLFVVQPLETSDPAMVARWLSPAGLIVDPATTLPGRFKPVTSAPLTRHCGEWPLRDAVSTSVDGTWQVLVARESDGAPGLAVRELGAGRMAMLAARAPLESQEIMDASARRFMTGLFQWLGDAGLNVEDLDADGLPDSVEDRNGDGAVNLGETDRMNPDTDGDGVPDGAEDRNRNGIVDEGETNPLDRDSDSDGIYDGADLSPLPIAKAQRTTGQ